MSEDTNHSADSTGDLEDLAKISTGSVGLDDVLGGGVDPERRN
jgi:RecA/RadA recombinase